MDGFGFGVQQKSEPEMMRERMLKDHINVWNRIIDNKGPIGIQKDQFQWEGRGAQLMEDEAFRSFIDADTIDKKITILRDTGLGTNKDMSNEELGQFLMTHAPSGLTEDPNVSEEAIEATSVNKENPFSSYYNYPKMWGNDPKPEERYYSDPEEKDSILPPWIK